MEIAQGQIVFARDYTLRLLDQIPTDKWFEMPAEVTHVAWQVGHLAMAEYRLGMHRLRGERPDDAQLISEPFLKAFGKGSVPTNDQGFYPTIEEIRATFDRVHEQALQELQDSSEVDLDSEVLNPHPIVKTKWDSLLWCAQHEMIHAGQIGLLRRQLGMDPLW
ncbi:MAG: DinB family protein [Gemmataceae bacterium]